MEFGEVVRRRRMVRSYDPERPVTEGALGAVLDAARRAPSAGFTQGVALLVLRDPADRADFWALTAERETRWLAGMRGAPVLVLVWTSREAYLDRYALPDKGWTDRDPDRWSAPYWFVDAGMAGMAALLAAVDQGLAACFFGVPRDRLAAVAARWRVPGDQLGVGVIALGHAAGSGAPGSPARRPRRPPGEVIHFDRW